MYFYRMSDISVPSPRSIKALKIAASAWYTPVLIGQWIFVAYILYAYGGPLIAGNPAGMNAHLSDAYVQSRTFGNVAVAAHLALAVIIHFFGPLQLVPAVRAKFPAFHRWSGRAFVVTVIIVVATGAYMLVARGIGAWTLRAGFAFQGFLILWFAWQTVRYARQRKFTVHMRWATRLFLAASAVWFFRVLIMIWFVLTGGIGIDQSNGTGWFIDAMSVLQFLPVVLYEVYWRIKVGPSSRVRFAFAIFLWFAALATTVGVGLTTLGMWFPVLG
ncbi:membrane protein [Algimonas arctica]|uniref:Membrane protein n=2 Tax=Algimonas arctica TaxID=1479486 RepID=A0A8J3CSE6_9PROT|nr:membrane protein [Algimonas arctica]